MVGDAVAFDADKLCTLILQYQCCCWLLLLASRHGQFPFPKHCQPKIARRGGGGWLGHQPEKVSQEGGVGVCEKELSS